MGTAVQTWGHVRMFNPWRYNIDRTCRALLQRHGWTAPDLETFPVGRELVARYLEPLASLPELSSRLCTGARVTGVARAGIGKVRNAGRKAAPFEVHFTTPEGSEACLLAQAVIDVSGTCGTHGWAGANGLPAIGERGVADRIRYGMPDILGADRGRYAGRRIMVLGSGDSALGSLIDLARLADEAPGTIITWVTRNRDLSRALGGGAADQLPERGALGMRVRSLVEQGALELLKSFAVEELDRTSDGALFVSGVDDSGGRSIEVDELVVATGLRPDLGILNEVRLDLDPALECPRALAPLIDPNLHSCGTVRPHGAAELEQPEPGLFIAGMKSYGRAPTFLLVTGYEQVRSIAAFLAGDIEASRRVELDLPQTGVCSSALALEDSPDCCGGPAPVGTNACCADDTEAKVAGKETCGCSGSRSQDQPEAELAE